MEIYNYIYENKVYYSFSMMINHTYCNLPATGKHIEPINYFITYFKYKYLKFQDYIGIF